MKVLVIGQIWDIFIIVIIVIAAIISYDQFRIVSEFEEKIQGVY